MASNLLTSPKCFPNLDQAQTMAEPLLSTHLWKLIADYPSLDASHAQSNFAFCFCESVLISCDKSNGTSNFDGAFPVKKENGSPRLLLHCSPHVLFAITSALLIIGRSHGPTESRFLFVNAIFPKKNTQVRC